MYIHTAPHCSPVPQGRAGCGGSRSLPPHSAVSPTQRQHLAPQSLLRSPTVDKEIRFNWALPRGPRAAVVKGLIQIPKSDRAQNRSVIRQLTNVPVWPQSWFLYLEPHAGQPSPFPAPLLPTSPLPTSPQHEPFTTMQWVRATSLLLPPCPSPPGGGGRSCLPCHCPWVSPRPEGLLCVLTASPLLPSSPIHI